MSKQLNCLDPRQADALVRENNPVPEEPEEAENEPISADSSPKRGIAPIFA